ncbi:Receptor-like protein kinase [Melia azedarach]|uniref:Receptor-like protein kinase n=1 Tax=Melia azedarach TaxID=155640 RepID=A0ACC1Y3B0_MELAZ|nr:Receptor-like protein kinase [Melia azedarach]
MQLEFQTNKQQQMWHVRSFPDGIRNCYRFNLTKGSRYLIRATFMYGNYDAKDTVPGFDLYIGPNKWGSVSLRNNASFVSIWEVIYTIPSNFLHFCLVNTGSGTPFINALELRPLFKNTTYITKSGSLNLFTRLDFASLTNLTVRYKDDVYDRIWWPYNSVNWAQLSTSLEVDAQGSNDYEPPNIVMKTAATPKNASKTLDFYLDIDDTTLQFYVYLHFAEVQVLQAQRDQRVQCFFEREALLPLKTLNLQGNKLTGSVPVELLERSKNGSLSLSVGGNPGLCSSISCKSKKKKTVTVPVVAAVAGSIFLLAAALAIFFIFRRKRQVGKVEAESRNKMESFEVKNQQFSYADILKITNNFEVNSWERRIRNSLLWPLRWN